MNRPKSGTDRLVLASLLVLICCLSQCSGEDADQEKGECQPVCDQEKRPVCGSDGRTYKNKCYLESYANCEKRKVKLAYDGPCGGPNRGTAECKLCPDLPKDPVCGTNNITYDSACHLDRHRCLGVNVHLSHPGKCNGQAQSLPKQKPECTGICTRERKPVCGSDGKTYSNLCYLQQSAACSGKDIQLAYTGRCHPEPARRAHAHRARPPGRCPALYDPVCGSDGKTYANMCLLERTRKQGKQVELAHMGTCKPSDPSEPSSSREAQRGDRSICLDPCQEHDYDPICGTNGETFDNYCKLVSYNECTGRGVQIAHDGECKKARELRSKPGDRRICNLPCEGPYDPVCGTNGKTFNTSCDLENWNECEEQDVKIAHHGVCKKKPRELGSKPGDRSICTLPCKEPYNPVCGTNGETYDTECDLVVWNHCSGQNILIAHDGECKKARELHSKPGDREICLRPCQEYPYDPICGTNGETYDSFCNLVSFNECTGQDVKIAHKGECKKARELGGKPGDRSICLDPCQEHDYEPLCGTNGETFDNICKLVSYNECTGRGVKIAYVGECKKARELHSKPGDRKMCLKPCQEYPYEPLCGTNGETFDSFCNLVSFNECTGQDVKIAHEGECKKARQLRGKRPWLKPWLKAWPKPPKPKPIPWWMPPPNYWDLPPYWITDGCDPNCGEDNEPLCGTNGQSFGNLCELKFFQCLGIKVKFRHEGECEQ